MNVTCPNCRRQGRVPKTLNGQQILCSFCKQSFVAEEDEPPPPAKPVWPGISLGLNITVWLVAGIIVLFSALQVFDAQTPLERGVFLVAVTFRLVATYIAARCAEKILAAFDRMHKEN